MIVDDQAKALAFYTGVPGFVKKTGLPAGKCRRLTVVAPDEPEGVEIVLEPIVNPAAKACQAAIFEQGIPITAFEVEGVAREYERLKARGVVFRGEAAADGHDVAARPRYSTSVTRTAVPRLVRYSADMKDEAEEGVHEAGMRLALQQARRAMASGEVPVGAVVLVDGQVVGEGFNQPIGSRDPTAHAEIVAIRAAAAAVGNYRLTGATLYVTVEPCLMCVGAMVHARIGTLVFGTAEPKAGAVLSTICAPELPSLNHRVEVVPGILEEECREIIQRFFRERRDRA
ncbi:MAG: tadA 1 [Acidobacteria bacterium]|nr:tadA 1 [Acidobacteriota bacterium]